MLNRSRSPFQPPQISGYKRPQRYQNQKRQRVQMSVEKPSQISMSLGKKRDQDLNAKQQLVSLVQDPHSVNSTEDQRFCFSIEQPILQATDIYWNYLLSNKVSNQYARKLIFKEQHYCLRGVDSQGISNMIYIAAINVPGYMKIDGTITNRVCSLQLVDQVPTIDASGQISYDVLYKQTQDVSWSIPMNVAQLRFQIYADETKLNGNLNIPLTCQFDIRHFGK